MSTVGIICEYDPMHLGHRKQLDRIRQLEGPDCGIVCLMSGSFVQRGKPAILPKDLRAKAAILSGADLVLELPVTVSLSSAEGFAAGGVALLGPFCDKLCFGAEDADPTQLLRTAEILLSDAFPPALRSELDKGKSFPAARAAALEALVREKHGVKNVITGYVGPVIGAHTGPGVLVLFFLGSQR